MGELQVVVRARRDGSSLSNIVLRKLGLPEDSYSFKEGECGLLRMAVPLIRTRAQTGLVVPMVRWDGDPRDYYVSVDDCRFARRSLGFRTLRIKGF